MSSPKLWRKKRGGRFIGSYHATVAGEDVNLRTTDAEEARTRLRSALQRGRRNFDDELEAAAALEDGDAADAMKAPAAPGSDHAGAPPDPVAAPPAPPPRQPPQPPDAGDVDDMAAAAADVAGGAANDNAAPPPEVDPEVLDGMLRTGALVLVDAQLQLQAALVKRYTGKVASVIPADSPMRAAAAEAWVAQLKIWVPADKMLPPWAMALILPVMCMPAQLAGAQLPADQGQQAAA
jgi:hypothetical protein